MIDIKGHPCRNMMIFFKRLLHRNSRVLILICILMFFLNSPASGKQTIDIAAIYALTGIAAENNSFSLEGIYYGVDEINATGGILGRKIKILEFDNKSTPIGSSLAAAKAVKSSAVAILGSAWSSHSLAVAKIAQQMEIPMISNVSTNPEVTKTGDYIFRICFTDALQGKVLAKFARQDLNAKTAVIFIDVASDYSLKLSEIFRLNFEQMGGKVVLELDYKPKQMFLKKEILQAVKFNADVIFIPGHDESGEIARKLQTAGARSIFLGGDGWASRVFLSRGGQELKQGYYSTHWSTQLDTQESNTFTQQYIRSEISAANIALGYDAVMLLANAVKRAGSFDRKKIKQAIADTLNFKGVTGTISFNKRGDPNKSAIFMVIRKGKPYYLKVLEP